MRFKLFIILIILALLFGCSLNQDAKLPIEEKPSPNGEIPDPDGEDKEPVKEPTEEELYLKRLSDYIDSLSIEEKIGQLVIAGLEGTEVTSREVQLIKEFHISGFIFFQRNISDYSGTKDLMDELRENSNPQLPLFFGVDEEGGLVTRLSGIYKNLPSLDVLGEKNDYLLSKEYGLIQGLKTLSLGFNLNFAPVLDVNSNPNNPVIGNRALSNDPNTVLQNGLALIDGYEESGVIPVAKHFPGHGDTSVDSHIDLPRVNKTKEELLKVELIPFMGAIEEGVAAIMVGHILMPELDDKPSSLSHEILTGILREDLSYKGLIISDDMTMGAITNYYGLEDASLEFLKSGGDLLLICHGLDTPSNVINRIKEGIINGEIDEKSIDEKLMRILRLKDKIKEISVELSRDDLEDMINNYLIKLK